jgi:hypothetical protein
MSALEDFRDMRQQLRAALLAREVVRLHGPHHPRNCLSAAAYSRAIDRMVAALGRLEVTPIASGDDARPALEVLEDVLKAIAHAEDTLRHAIS